MLLALLRHAPAEEAVPGLADADRALTPRGRRRLEAMRRALRRAGLRFDALHHSPLRRAAETAAGLVRLVEGPVRSEPLLCAAPTPALLERLGGRRPLLVGHQPWLGELLAWLVLGDAGLGAAFDWRKTGLALLVGEPSPGRMRLKAFAAPGLLRRRRG